MTTTTITRYRCDWCGTGAQVGHSAGVPPPLPLQWEHAELDRKRWDLCKLCTETLRTVLASDSEPSRLPNVVAARRHSRERPGYGRLAGRFTTKPALPRPLRETRRMLRDRLVVSGLCVVLSVALVAGASATGSVPVIFATAEKSTPTATESRSEAMALDAHAAAAETAAAPSSGDAPAAVVAPATPAVETPAAIVAAPGGPTVDGVTAIGDSVMLAAAENLRQILGEVEVDATVGRQASGALEVLRARRAAGTLGSVVVLHIGHNGPMDQAQVEEMMTLLADVPTVLVLNLRVARPWESENNAVLSQAVARRANAALVDWASASANRPELFWEDKVHITPAGAVVYADVVSRQLAGGQPTLVQQPGGTTPEPSATAAATPVATAAPATATVASALQVSPASASTLTLTAVQSAQVRITLDGAATFSGVLAAGESQSWDAKSTVLVWTNNASKLLISINGYDLGAMSVAVGHPEWNTVNWSWPAKLEALMIGVVARASGDAGVGRVNV